jgi:hypothetical protein
MINKPIFNSTMTIVVFAIAGVFSGLLLAIWTQFNGFLSEYPMLDAAQNIVVPSFIFSTILFAVLSYYDLIVDNNWKKYSILVIATGLGWTTSLKIMENSMIIDSGISLAGIIGALFIAVALIWMADIKKKKAIFVLIICVFGFIGALVYEILDPLYKEPVSIFPIWQSIVLMGIATSFLSIKDKIIK